MPTAAHDPSAGTDTGDVLVGIGTSQNLVLHVSGTEGDLALLHVCRSAGAATVTPPTGWVLIATNTGTAYVQQIWRKRIGADEPVAVVACANSTGPGSLRFIGRAVIVAAAGSTGFFDDPVFFEASVLAPNPALSAGFTYSYPRGARSLVLLFAAGRRTTYAFAQATELDAERVAGTTGSGSPKRTSPRTTR
jgi:hypothetical protein